MDGLTSSASETLAALQGAPAHAAQSMRFHESWSPEQRALLLELARAMEEYPARAAARLGGVRLERAACIAGAHLAASCASLHQLAAEGRAPQPESPMPPVVWAMGLGKLAAAGEIVRRGSSPAALLPPDVAQGTVFTYAIACCPLLGDECPPWDERRELLELMLRHGADPTAHAQIALRMAGVPFTYADCPPEDDATGWLLDHGLTATPDDIAEHARRLVTLAGTLPAIQGLVSRGRLSLDSHTLASLLNTAVGCGVPDAPEKTLFFLRSSATPQHLCRDALENWRAVWPRYADSPSLTPEQTAEGFKLLQVLEYLLAAGGELPHPELSLPRHADLRARFCALVAPNARG